MLNSVNVCEYNGYLNNLIGERLVVVCSIDVNILKSALVQKYKLAIGKSGLNLAHVVRDQIDKLFVSSISLPKLKELDYIEFLQELSGVDSIEISGATITVQSKDILSTDERSNSVTSDKPTANLDIKRLIELIMDEVTVECPILTPRQIRILYSHHKRRYRLKVRLMKIYVHIHLI